MPDPIRTDLDQTTLLRHYYGGRGEHWLVAIEQGHDVSLIEEMLRATPAERLDRHQGFLETLLWLEDVRRGWDAAN